MAPNTPFSQRNLVIYEVFPRNHSQQGNFLGVEEDLPRIRSMGVDIVWLMPIYPIGKVARKGSLGSPYSIVDYRATNPEYGSMADFQRLVDTTHKQDMLLMIDIVFNHTAHDSVLVEQHPGWFHQDPSGKPVTTVPEWSDVIDLKYPNQDLEGYLVETLQMWVKSGVDGFRCDVASLVPPSFWIEARKKVQEVKPVVIWLAESVHASFVANRREVGLRASSDCEIYQAFDLTYDYDIWPIWQKAVRGEVPVRRYLEMLRFQDAIYPLNYVKMRAVENHDQPRIFAFAPSPEQAQAWMAFEAFNRGSFLIYAGLESGAQHTPSLFDRDLIDWDGYDYQQLVTKLAGLKKDLTIREGVFRILEAEPAIQASWYHPNGSLYGVFNVTGEGGDVQVHLPNGRYVDLLSEQPVEVHEGRTHLPSTAAILRYQYPINMEPIFSELLDD